MSIFDVALILFTTPAIAFLLYGTYLCMTGKDRANDKRVLTPQKTRAKPPEDSDPFGLDGRPPALAD